MKLPNALLIISLTTLLTSCKETASQAVPDETSTEKKEVVTLKKPAQKPEVATLKIEGMTCAMGCAKTIEKSLTSLEGVQKARVDFEKKEAIINFDAAVVNPDKLAQKIESCADGKTYKVIPNKS